MKGRGKRKIPDKTRRPTASSRHDSHKRKSGGDAVRQLNMRHTRPPAGNACCARRRIKHTVVLCPLHDSRGPAMRSTLHLCHLLVHLCVSGGRELWFTFTLRRRPAYVKRYRLYAQDAQLVCSLPVGDSPQRDFKRRLCNFIGRDCTAKSSACLYCSFEYIRKRARPWAIGRLRAACALCSPRCIVCKQSPRVATALTQLAAAPQSREDKLGESQRRTSGSDPARNRARFPMVVGERPSHYTTAPWQASRKERWQSLLLLGNAETQKLATSFCARQPTWCEKSSFHQRLEMADHVVRCREEKAGVGPQQTKHVDASTYFVITAAAFVSGFTDSNMGFRLGTARKPIGNRLPATTIAIATYDEHQDRYPIAVVTSQHTNLTATEEVLLQHAFIRRGRRPILRNYLRKAALSQLLKEAKEEVMDADGIAELREKARELMKQGDAGMVPLG
ncbi:hypothetical protein PR048_009355 [Dryococelus australis]|uniref:Uncharacterized protein n=1 Tax=Dryococelus australis TaxID=614101 RepID=A0ABQ9HZM3_9NEOP|nr:hypothetical protein PR048_009355 [Dryococelus australis]